MLSASRNPHIMKVLVFALFSAFLLLTTTASAQLVFEYNAQAKFERGWDTGPNGTKIAVDSDRGKGPKRSPILVDGRPLPFAIVIDEYGNKEYWARVTTPDVQFDVHWRPGDSKHARVGACTYEECSKSYLKEANIVFRG